MPSFRRSGDFYGASLITGPRSALVRLRFADDHIGPPAVVVLGADERYGNPSDADVAKNVGDAVKQANYAFGSEYVAAEIHYKCDNDSTASLIQRAAYIIVGRLAEIGGDSDFNG